MTAMLDGALLCAQHNLHIIPVWRAVNGVCTCPNGAQCVSPGKHPAIDSWQNKGTTDRSIITKWLTNGHAGCNIGVVAGLSKIIIIDKDPRNGGDETYARLVAELGELPATVTADTGGGGTHEIFLDPGYDDLESKLGPGVDLLHGARQILVEPSVHASGRPYTWRSGLSPRDVAIAVMPSAWIERSRRKPVAPRTPLSSDVHADDYRIKRASKYLEKIPGAISGDSGHTATFNAVAAVMFGFDLTAEQAFELIADEYNPRCDPPWSERELRHKIKSVAERCTRERGYLLQTDRPRPRIGSTGSATSHQPSTAIGGTNWASLLITKKDGTAKKLYHNVVVFVRNHPDYRDKWSMDEMTCTPWFDDAAVRETMIHEIRADVERRLAFTPTVADVKAAVVAAAYDRPFHPIRQYLRSLDWDGVPRLHAMARDYLGSDEDHHAEMIRRWMIGAAARAINPGCKLDTALMLVGQQGYRKSTFFSILGGQWHSDTAIDITHKDSYLQLHSSWIYELAELENVVHGRAESRLKAWMSSSHDTFRAPYARETVKHPRAVVICGTTNREQFLTDDTGSRRFWIIPVRAPIPCELLAEMRDQLWAEATCAAESGEPWWLSGELEAIAEESNSDFAEQDSWEEPIGEYLSNPNYAETTITDVLGTALKIEVARHGRGEQMRCARILKKLGWFKTQRRVGDGRPRFYTRHQPKVGDK